MTPARRAGLPIPAGTSRRADGAADAEGVTQMNDVEDAWDEWMHFNWSDDNDMELVEAAFRAGFAAGSEPHDQGSP